MDAIYNFFKRMHTSQKLILAFCILVITCTLYRECVLCTYVPKLDGFFMNKKEGFRDEEESEESEKETEETEDLAEHFENVIEEDFENMPQTSMVLFYAPWCPHCKSMMGDWNKLKKHAPKHINIAKVNCDKKPHMAAKHKVKGFPTIILFKNGKKIPYQGPRDLDHFLNFLQGY